MTGPSARALLFDHPCLGVPGPTFLGVRLRAEPGEARAPGRLARRDRLVVAAQCVAFASLLWEMGYWAGHAAFSNARVLRDEKGVRTVLTSVPRGIDAVVQRLGGGDTGIRRLRDGTLRAISDRAALPGRLFAPAGGPDWLGFDPWLGRLLDELGTPLDPWTARSLWALCLEPIPLPSPGEIAYWSLPWPDLATRYAAAAVSGIRETGVPAWWMVSGAGDTATAPQVAAGGGGGALVLSGRFRSGELHAVERWLADDVSRRAVVVGTFPAGWEPAVPTLVGEGGLERSLLMTGADGETLRLVRHRWRGRFRDDPVGDGRALTALARHRFHEGPAVPATLDPTSKVLSRCLALLPEGVPVSFLSARSGLDERQVISRAGSLGAELHGERFRLPVPELLRPDPLHLQATGLLPPGDPRRLVAEWLGGEGDAGVARWARERLGAMDGIAVLELLSPVAPDVLTPGLLELLAEAAVDVLDLALLRPLVERMEGSAGRVWRSCLEALDCEDPARVEIPGLDDVPAHPRAAAEAALRLLNFRSHRGRGGTRELGAVVAAGAERLGGLLRRRLHLEARLMVDPGLLEDRRWRREAVEGSAELSRVLRRRAGVLRMAQGRHREARRLLEPLAEREELPGRAGLLELDLGALALDEGRWGDADIHLLRALRLLRAAGFVHRTRTVSFDLAVGELDRLRLKDAARRFREAGAREEDPVARAELARLALARGDEEELRRLCAGLPRGDSVARGGLAEGVAMLDGVAALLRHDLASARELLARGGDEGRSWLALVAALEGETVSGAPESDGWGLDVAARYVACVREGRPEAAAAMLQRDCTSAREALALALCERLLGRQGWIGAPLRRQAIRILGEAGMRGWAAFLGGEAAAERAVIEIASRLLDEGRLETVPGTAWMELLESMGAGGLEVRTRAGGDPVWSVGEGLPGGELRRGLITVVPLGADGRGDARWELLASVFATVVAECVPQTVGEDDLGMVGRAPVLEELRREIRRLAPGPVPVVFLGETGVGKELAARALHRLSGRRGPFVPINMAALPQELAEAELFGALKGAFTGADRTRRGLIAAADGGTLFLDEIGDLDLRLQAKLLRFLESGEVRPVGSESVRQVDVRIVSATNRDLEAAQRDGTFRPDLFYRIGSAMIRIPPLRERREDIALLVDHFTNRLALRDGGRSGAWSTGAIEALKRHSWPGNIRELRNIVEVALLRAGGGTVRAQHLPLPEEPAVECVSDPELPYERAIQEFRRSFIARALERNGNNRSATARELGISRQTLLYHIRALGIR